MSTQVIHPYVIRSPETYPATDRQKNFISVIDVSLRGIKSSYSHLHDILSELTSVLVESGEEGTETERVLRLEAMVKVWSLVDGFFRLHASFEAMSELLRLSPRIQSLNRQLAQSENFRHHLQHLRSLKSNETALGGLSWFYRDDLTAPDFPHGRGFVMDLPPGEAITIPLPKGPYKFHANARVAFICLTLVQPVEPLIVSDLALKAISLETEIHEAFLRLQPRRSKRSN